MAPIPEYHLERDMRRWSINPGRFTRLCQSRESEPDTFLSSSPLDLGELQDFWSVYHDKLSFLKTVNEKDIFLRTSNELRTHQVAGGLLYGMDPNVQATTFPVHCQPDHVYFTPLRPSELTILP